MRIKRGDAIAGIDALQVRKYFRRYGSGVVNYVTAMEAFSLTKRKAEKKDRGLRET